MWSRSPALKNTTKCVVLHSLVYNNYKIIIITIIIIRIISPSKSVIVSFLVTNATDRLWSLVLQTLIIFLFSSYKKTCNFLYMKNYETYDFTNILYVIQVLLRLGPENHYFLSIPTLFKTSNRADCKVQELRLPITVIFWYRKMCLP